MNKKDLFFLQAPYVGEDGTYEELLDVFLRHPQEDEKMLKEACEEISEYISFCMYISVRYWCEERKTFTQYFPKGTRRNPEIWEMRLFDTGEMITNETTDFSNFRYLNLSKLVEMYKFEKRAFETLNPEEKERKQRYRVPYGFLFSLLLEGKKF